MLLVLGGVLLGVATMYLVYCAVHAYIISKYFNEVTGK
jgi:hypothetical protein